MPDPFDQTLIAAADSFFLLPGSEYIDYLPASGSNRRIRAVVERLTAEEMPELSGGSRPRWRLLVKNDVIAGIASSEIDTGGDKIELAPNVNERPIVMRLTEVVNQDAGMMSILAW